MSNSVQYDVAMCSDYVIEALVEQDQLEEIDTSKIPNYSRLGEGYLSPSYDPTINGQCLIPAVVSVF